MPKRQRTGKVEHARNDPCLLPFSIGKVEDTRGRKDEQVGGGEMGEKESQNGVCI